MTEYPFIDHLPKDPPSRFFLHKKDYNFYGHNKLTYEFSDILSLNQKNFNVFCDLKRTPLPETLDEHIFWRPECILRSYKTNNNIKQEIENRKLWIIETIKSIPQNATKLNGIYVDLTHSFGWYPYGHLFDTLQRLHAIKDIIQNKSIKFLVSDYIRVTDFLDHLTALCGRNISNKDVVVAKKNFRIQQLIYSLSPSIIPQLTSKTYLWIMTQYYKHFGISDPTPQYNLYLDRNHVRQGSRSVINNAEVLSYLKNRDYTIIKGNESIRTIINLFANAKTIVGPHGSLFVNTIFCPPWTKIIEFCPHNRVDVNLKEKYKVATNYQQIIAEADQHHNISIDVNELDRLLNI